MIKELFDPRSNEWLLNKYDYYTQIREADYAYYSEKYQMYIITRYDDVMFALKKPNIFSSSGGNMLVEMPHRLGKTLGASDNPTHDLLKNVIKNAYSKHNLERIATVYREKIRTELIGKNKVDLTKRLDYLSACAVVEMINPPLDKEEIANLVVDMQWNAPQSVLNASKPELSDRFMKMIMKEIDNNTPSSGPGIYHEFITNDKPDKYFGISSFTAPLFAGVFSLTAGIQFLILDLFRENKYKEVLNNPSLILKAIDESLRFNASTCRMRRTIKEPVTIHGVDLIPGNAVCLCYDAANRDPVYWDRPEYFDINRNTTELAFGHGLHACIAIYFSKALMSVFLEEWINIIGDYTIPIKNEDLQYVITYNGNDDKFSNLYAEKCQ